MDLEESQAQTKAQTNHFGTIIGLFIYLCLNISMMIWGIRKKDECPADPRIPLYLIVEGAAGITTELLSLINRKLKWKIINLLLFILYLFQLIWSILGSVWVYQIYKPDFDPRPDNNYCSAVAYLSVFCLLTIYWICVALFIVISFCCRFILVAKQK